MTNSNYTLKAWRDAIASLEQVCPWPGPRPLRPTDEAALLCGRDDDSKRFRRVVDEHNLVFLSGASGVGKTSLLLRGFVPGLEKEGNYVVATIRNWSGMADGVEPAEFMAQRTRADLADRYPDLPNDVTIFGALIERFGDKMVFVLDQFEELIRDAPAFKEELFEFLAYLNQRQPVKIVISLRNEYIHELRTLESMARPFSVRTYHLDDVADGAALEIISAANKVKPESIDSLAPEVLATAWLKARSRGAGFAARPPGLLHLQALLYVLHHHAGGEQVTSATITSLQTQLGIEQFDDEVGAHLLFEKVVQHAIDIKLDRCQQAARQIGLDPFLIEGTARMLDLCIPHLSSAGYKLVREANDLFKAAFGEDLATLERGILRSRQSLSSDSVGDGAATPQQHRDLFDAVVKTVLADRDKAHDPSALDLFSPRVRFAQAADGPGLTQTTWADRLHAGAEPLAADRAEVTSGPMLGLAPTAVLIEELRRFAFALEWLQSSDLIRLSTPGTEAVMVSLVHDGFGPALLKWSRESGVAQTAPLYGITAPLGADFHWRVWGGSEDDVLRALDGTALDDGSVDPLGIKVFANLRWRGSRLSANIRNVVFVNCDFRGSSIDQCSLQGVTFVNCLLDGLMISDCKIQGTVPPFNGELADRARAFELHDVDELVRILSWYRGIKDERDVLLANEPESPSEPALADSSRRVLVPHIGGVAIYGGRTSSLLLRKCSFPNGGNISLRETAGSGFDVVEHQNKTSIEILGSRLRHLTFTSSPTEAGGGEEIHIDVRQSVLAQVWVGNDLNGSFTAKDCMLIGIWNGSPTFEAKVVPTDAGEGSRFYNLVGVELQGDHEALVPGETARLLEDITDAGHITNIAVGMDYRRHPSYAEYGAKAQAEDTGVAP